MFKGCTSIQALDGFPDVKSTDYFNSAVTWAKENKITSGMGDGTFGAGRSISRESLAIMIYSFAKSQNIKTEVTPGTSDGYADSSKISSFAKESMDWAVTQGILSGKGSGEEIRLDPAGKAARAEFAMMITKLLQ